MRRTTVLAALFAALTPILLFAGLAAAGPQPVDLCGVCGDSLKGYAQDDGFDVAVESSTVTVHLREDGSSRWTVENRLAGPDVDALRGSGELERLSRRGLPPGAENASAAVDDDGTMTVAFDVPNFAEPRRGGVLYVDYFEGSGDGYTTYGYDLVVRGPPGTEVVHAPSDGSSDDGALVLERDLGPNTFATFGPTDRLGTAALSAVAVVDERRDAIWWNLTRLVVVPASVFFMGVALVEPSNRPAESARSPRVRALGAGVAAVGAVGLVALPSLFGGHLLVAGASLLFLATGAALAVPRLRSRLRGPPRRAWATVFALFAGLSAALVLLATTVDGVPSGGWSRLGPATWLLPAVALYPLGVARGRGADDGIVFVAPATFALVALSAVSLTAEPGGWSTFRVIVFAVAAVAAVVVGLPVAALGWVVGAESEDGVGRPR